MRLGIHRTRPSTRGERQSVCTEIVHRRVAGTGSVVFLDCQRQCLSLCIDDPLLALGVHSVTCVFCQRKVSPLVTSTRWSGGPTTSSGPRKRTWAGTGGREQPQLWTDRVSGGMRAGVVASGRR